MSNMNISYIYSHWEVAAKNEHKQLICHKQSTTIFPDISGIFLNVTTDQPRLVRSQGSF